jgi:hypothetical protein
MDDSFRGFLPDSLPSFPHTLRSRPWAVRRKRALRTFLPPTPHLLPSSSLMPIRNSLSSCLMNPRILNGMNTSIPRHRLRQLYRLLISGNPFQMVPLPPHREAGTKMKTTRPFPLQHLHINSSLVMPLPRSQVAGIRIQTMRICPLHHLRINISLVIPLPWPQVAGTIINTIMERCPLSHGPFITSSPVTRPIIANLRHTLAKNHLPRLGTKGKWRMWSRV